MTHPKERSELIAQLAGELRPVRPLRTLDGTLLAAFAAAVTLGATAIALGIRPAILDGQWTAMFILTNGLFLLLGAAAAASVVRLAMPYVGNQPDAWRWGLGAACLLPLAALATAAVEGATGPDIVHPADDLGCILYGSLLGIFTAVALTLWLRRGAPTRPGRAGFLTELAAGAIGMAAYGFHCPVESIYHLGLAHAVPVLIWAGLGWAIVPRLIRW